MTLTAEMARARRFAFDPRTVTRVPAMRGEFVNVAEAGYRFGAEQQPWPPRADETAVFVFGGSTAFGHGLPDGETIPAALEAVLRARGTGASVYNFGSINHASDQERARFFELLLDGHVPRAAVFLDGFADFVAPYYAPVIERPLRRAMADGGLLTRLRDRRAGQSPATPDRDTAATLQRYLVNMRLTRAAAAAFGVQPLFVWQPVPCYAYPDVDTGDHEGAEHIIVAIQDGYDRMSHLRASFEHDDFLWLADMQAERRDALYVDPDHYNAAFSREIAETITDRLAALIG